MLRERRWPWSGRTQESILPRSTLSEMSKTYDFSRASNRIVALPLRAHWCCRAFCLLVQLQKVATCSIQMIDCLAMTWSLLATLCNVNLGYHLVVLVSIESLHLILFFGVLAGSDQTQIFGKEGLLPQVKVAGCRACPTFLKVLPHTGLFLVFIHFKSFCINNSHQVEIRWIVISVKLIHAT